MPRRSAGAPRSRSRPACSPRSPGATPPGTRSPSSCRPGRRSACRRRPTWWGRGRPPRSSRCRESDARFVDRGAGDRAFATLSAVTELLLRPARRTRPPALARRGRPSRRATARRGRGRRGRRARAAARHRRACRARRRRVASGRRPPRRTRWLVVAAPGALERARARLARAAPRRAARAAAPARPHRVGPGAARLPRRGCTRPAARWIRERTDQAAREAEQLGITGSSTPSTPGQRAAARRSRGGDGRDGRAVPRRGRQGLPAARPVDHRARPAARRRSTSGCAASPRPRPRGLASTYRVTASSVTRALTRGRDGARDPRVPRRRSRSPASRSRSSTCSPTPPRASARCASARSTRRADPMPGCRGRRVRALRRRRAARPASSSTRTSRRSPCGASATHRVVTRFDAAVLFWTLADARYPVVAEDAAGEVVALRRERRAGGGIGRRATTPRRSWCSGCARSRPASPRRPGTAWLARQLELAIRNKLTVTVTVRLPDGSRGRLPARAGRPRRRTAARARPPRRHRAHAAAVVASPAVQPPARTPDDGRAPAART